ncbi:MAG: hypothetical protein JWL65_5626 [Gammaproteobacteria bacterium]|nr:hypothetical protein [Gammaproteobacteria bacterium]
MLALAAGALGLFYILFFPKPRANSDEIVRPLSSESRPEGYLAVWRWLGEQNIHAVSLRYRYDRLPTQLSKPTGNLLLVTLPQWVPARTAEIEKLEGWVERGNTLLIMAAIHDTPLWSLDADPLLKEKVEQLTGLHLETLPAGKADLKALLADRLDVVPRGEHPLLAGVRHITAASKLPVRNARLNGPDDSIPLELAGRADSGEPTLWLMRRGAGQILLSSVSSPFSNGAVTLTDNARFLANIIAWCCGPGATVVFDDAHQGATAYYDGRAFFADPRLHHTLGWIVFLWLALVLGALPLRAAQRSWQPLDEGAFVEASARYLAHVVPASEAAQRLIESFLRRLGAGTHPDREPALWELFDEDSRVLDPQRRALHVLYEQACAGKRVNLVRLQNLLAQLRENLA